MKLDVHNIKSHRNLIVLILIVAVIIRAIYAWSANHLDGDSDSFIEVAEYILDSSKFDHIPYRMANPLYSIFVLDASFIVTDYQWASKFVSVLSGAFLIIPVYLLSKKMFNRHIATIASIFVCLSIPLVSISGMAHSDSLFILFSLMAIYFAWTMTEENPSVYKMICFSLFCGLAYLSRANGLPYFVVGIAYYFFVRTFFYKTGIRNVLWNVTIAVLVFALFFFAPRAYIARSSRPIHDYTKVAIFDGTFYVSGDNSRYNGSNRDSIVYGLNEECTALGVDHVFSESITQHIADNPKRFVRKILVNLKSLIGDGLRQLICPYIILGFPLVFGVINEQLWSRRRGIFILSWMIFYILILPGLIYRNLYLYPIAPLFIIILSIGIPSLAERLRNILNRGIDTEKMVIVFMVIILSLTISARIALGLSNHRNEYKIASEWVKANLPEDAVIMSRNSMYGYTLRKRCHLPYDDSLDRVLKYAKYKGVEYIILGKDERKHNPQLSFLFDKNNQPEELELVYEDRESIESPLLIYRIKQTAL
jgi:4-amino-4-deoxy-L-arabinose transferase-like glycosyltransferase